MRGIFLSGFRLVLTTRWIYSGVNFSSFVYAIVNFLGIFAGSFKQQSPSTEPYTSLRYPATPASASRFCSVPAPQNVPNGLNEFCLVYTINMRQKNISHCFERMLLDQIFVCTIFFLQFSFSHVLSFTLFKKK